eukprot:2548142-Pyramimonas_sp.AAC.1
MMIGDSMRFEICTGRLYSPVCERYEFTKHAIITARSTRCSSLCLLPPHRAFPHDQKDVIEELKKRM